jgi:hypothetical protein
MQLRARIILPEFLFDGFCPQSPSFSNRAKESGLPIKQSGLSIPEPGVAEFQAGMEEISRRHA